MAKFKQRTSSHKVKNYSVYSRFCYKYTIPISRECVCACVNLPFVIDSVESL